jgi:hypothetical protein
MKKILLLAFIFAISGCSLGFVATDLKPVKANLEYWMKPGMTEENRIRDAGDCGGGYTNYTGFSESAIAARKIAGETDLETRGRLFHEWERCVLNKGYRYTGNCYDNEISRASPACGAR